MKCTLLLIHRPKNLISKGIRFFTDSYWNHSAILVDGWVIEAEYPKVRKIKYVDWLEINANREVYLIDNLELKNDIRNLVGIKYDLGVFINELLFYATKNEYFANRDAPNKWYCHELSAFALGLPNYWKSTGRTLAENYYIAKK